MDPLLILALLVVTVDDLVALLVLPFVVLLTAS